MRLIEVNTKQQEKGWIFFPVRLSLDDPNFIRHIDREVMAVFHRKVNKFYTHEASETVRWL